MRGLYRIHDRGAEKGCFFVPNEAEARAYNVSGWGIFRCVNEMKSERRTKENVERIAYWAVDVDLGKNNSFQSKQEALEAACDRLYPSLVIETRNGIHVYFAAKDGTVDDYTSIVGDRLVPILGGDPNAKDPARILREPGFFHHKESPPFKVGVMFRAQVSYSTREMLRAFKIENPDREFEAQQKQEIRSHFDSEDVFDRMWDMSQMDLLKRLSGTQAVRGERYTFQKTTGNKFNILVNGASTSCWIDERGRIGSLSKGGPSVWQWLRWFGMTGKEAYAAIKVGVPELWTTKT